MKSSFLHVIASGLQFLFMPQSLDHFSLLQFNDLVGGFKVAVVVRDGDHGFAPLFSSGSRRW